MNFKINRRKLPYPNNIIINSMHSINSLIITWDHVKNPDEDIRNGEIVGVKYNIYRGTAISGIFYKLNEEPLSENKFEDKRISLNPNTQYFYKVSTVAIFNDGIESEGPLSPPVIFAIPTTNKWFKKMNERNMWILKNTGVLMDLYVRKTEGPRCSKCYDEIRGQAGDSNCTNCFGTGFEGGYEPMCQLYVRQKPASSSLDLTSHGYSLNSNPGAWTISKIMLKNRDILINPYGQMFSVVSSTLSHVAGYFLHQELQLKEIDYTDIRHKIKRVTLYPEI